MTLPLHCMPPMPDWGLKPKEQHIPTVEEIVQKFSNDERVRVAYTSSLLMRLLRHFIINDVVFNLKYPRKPEFKSHSRELQGLCRELEIDAEKAHHPESIKWLDDCFWKFKREYQEDIYKLHLFVSSALLKSKKNNDDLQIGVVLSLLAIERINKHGEYISKVVAERSGLDYQEFVPSHNVVLTKVLLLDMADILDCNVASNATMNLAMDILIKRYLEILKV